MASIRRRGGSHDGINSPPSRPRGRTRTPVSMRTSDVSRSPVRTSRSTSLGDSLPSEDMVIDRSSYNHSDTNYGYYVDPRQSFESSSKPASVQELQLRREELLRKYKEIQDQLSDLDDALHAAEVVSAGNGSTLRAEVYVNGQPITRRSIKKAEKFAGKIQPGEYWYDSKAGFWGVMGRQGLGIIPPSIQEFSSPMPENCSKGDSAVYVNGRELPKEDLDLLSSRGLPTTRDKHYVVNISGKVLDEETGDFAVNLGRLAPTVESRKCGFGMFVPYLPINLLH